MALGQVSQGYSLIAPLDASDRLDLAAWREQREACTVIRFKAGLERDADGWLTHNGSHWFFHYDEAREGDDEPVYRLGDHRLALGDYLTIHESDGATLTYRVTQRTPVANKSAGHPTKETA
jgi:hypothetical protein